LQGSDRLQEQPLDRDDLSVDCRKTVGEVEVEAGVEDSTTLRHRLGCLPLRPVPTSEWGVLQDRSYLYLSRKQNAVMASLETTKADLFVMAPEAVINYR